MIRKITAGSWRPFHQILQVKDCARHATVRHYSTPPPHASRLSRLESRLPRLLQSYLAPLRNAPVSHITAFLLLHELTAIVPLFGLAATFHYANWLPSSLAENKYVSEGTEKFGKYLRRKGWISESGEDADKSVDGGVRIVVELATAYAITKALLPVRLVASVWATPWFARTLVIPVSRVLRLSAPRGGG